MLVAGGKYLLYNKPRLLFSKLGLSDCLLLTLNPDLLFLSEASYKKGQQINAKTYAHYFLENYDKDQVFFTVMEF